MLREHQQSGQYCGPRVHDSYRIIRDAPHGRGRPPGFFGWDAGVGMCNVTGCCKDDCPQGIRITANAIIPLTERMADRYYDPLKKWLYNRKKKLETRTPWRVSVLPLMITGLVRHPIEVPPQGMHVSRPDRVEDFHCLEGWVRPNQAWSGLRLAELVGPAAPLPDAQFVEIASSNLVAVVSFSDMDSHHVLLADTQNSQQLKKSTDPWRLVVSGAACYQSVKSGERITVVRDSLGETARTLALSRINKS